MTDLDVHDRIERLMTDEPPHRPLPDLVRTGERRLLLRRLQTGAGALALVAVAGAGATIALPDDPRATVRDRTNVADGAGPSLISPTDLAGPQGPSAYTYRAGPGCGSQSVGQVIKCKTYKFQVAGVRDSVVAAVEYRLIDGSTKKVPAIDGEYHLVMTGPLPAGDRFTKEEGLVDAQGSEVDLFAGLTLYAVDGSVLGTATATDSAELDAYPEYCNLLAKDEPCVRP